MNPETTAADERLTCGEPDKPLPSVSTSETDGSAPVPGSNLYVNIKDGATPGQSSLLNKPGLAGEQTAPANVYEERVAFWGLALKRGSAACLV